MTKGISRDEGLNKEFEELFASLLPFYEAKRPLQADLDCVSMEADA